MRLDKRGWGRDVLAGGVWILLVQCAEVFARPEFPLTKLSASTAADVTAAMLRRHYIISRRGGSKRADQLILLFLKSSNTKCNRNLSAVEPL